MKKNLIALAVLAASTASFAQVSVTGSLIAGYRDSSAPATTGNASGFGVDTAEITFNAKEDLGGGMKASASLGLVDQSRGNTFGAGDTVLSLEGAFGKLSVSTVRNVDYLTGGLAAVGGTGFDDKLFNSREINDSVSYSVPLGPVGLNLSYVEPTTLLGLGQGTSGDAAKTTQRNAAIGLTYANAALAADVGYAMYDQADVISSSIKSDVRGAVSYDLGAAKLGGGVVQRNYKTGTRTDALLAVGVPMGALTLGANVGQRNVSGTDDLVAKTTAYEANGTRNGYGLKASYALSKRTAFSVDYTNWANQVGDSSNSTQTNVLLSHSF